MAEIRECKYCYAPILFIPSATSGKWMPINPRPDEAGNIVLELARAADTGTKLSLNRAVVVKPGERPGELRFKHHAATCTARPRRSRSHVRHHRPAQLRLVE